MFKPSSLFLSFVVVGVFFGSGARSGYACTVWAALGEGITRDGSTLVFKVRDEKPLRQALKTVDDGNGLAFRGLFVGERETFNTGINAKGLFVGRTTAGSVPSAIRRALPDFRSQEGWHAPKFLLKRCGSVAEALRQTQVYASGHPVNYILADRKEIALVECATGGKFAVRRLKRGTLFHTNHYVFPELLDRNLSIGSSSKTRFARIETLLRKTDQPLTLEKCIAFSRDHHDGALESICREGADPSNPKKTRTVAIIGARIPKEGAPTFYVRYLPMPLEAVSGWEERTEDVHFQRP